MYNNYCKIDVISRHLATAGLLLCVCVCVCVFICICLNLVYIFVCCVSSIPVILGDTEDEERSLLLHPVRAIGRLMSLHSGFRSRSTLFLHGICMLRECIYGGCAHEQHVRRTLTLTLTHTITAVLSKWKCCTCAHAHLCN